MNKQVGTNVALGAAAGAAATGMLRGMMKASMRLAPGTLPPMKEDPGQFMVKQAERMLPERLRKKVRESWEQKAATLLAFGYGMSFATLYAAVGRRSRSALADGALLGGVTWATGSLGWLPATRLVPPVWRQKPKQVIPNLLSHVLFGVASVALFRWARNRSEAWAG